MARPVRMTLEEVLARASDTDRAIIDATTEADISRHADEDGEIPDAFAGPSRLMVPASSVRRQLGMSQQAFAALIGVPVGTLRNWEQGRVMPDPAARSLLTILAKEPQAALRALQSGREGSSGGI